MSKFSLDTSRFYAAELADIIHYMHHKNVIHRDIKPSNILITASGHLKLTDFGTSKILKGDEPPVPSLLPATTVETPANEDDEFDLDKMKRERAGSFVGTAEYVPPELLNSEMLTYGSDWWSFGIVLYELLTGKVPFKGSSEYLTFQAILNQELVFPPNFDEAARDLISRLLNRDKSARLGLYLEDGDTILNHAFFERIRTRVASDIDEGRSHAVFGLSAPKYQSIRAEEVPSSHRASSVNAQLRLDKLNLNNNKSNLFEAIAPGNLTMTTFDEDQWKKYLDDDETIICAGQIVKSSKWSKTLFAKKRILILTNQPRLIYIDESKGIVKGEVPWSDALGVEVMDNKKFFIHVPGRSYLIHTEFPPAMHIRHAKSSSRPSAASNLPISESDYVISNDPTFALQWRYCIEKAQKIFQPL